MKNWLLSVAVVVASVMTVAPTIAEAKRFGGGGFSGMKRSMPASPNKPAAAPQAAPAPGAGTAAAAGRSGWMGPIAGLAAGLGIAALMSHLGLSEAFGNFLMIALLALAAVMVIRFLMRRANPQQPATAGAGAGPAAPSWNKLVPAEADANPRRVETPASPGANLAADGRTLLSPLGGQPNGRPASLPADFDVEAFERIAKMIFVRMQAANDAGDLEDLRSFTTPEMFAMARIDLQDRKGKAQTTDVVHVDAEVLDLEQQGERQVVSVRFHGQIREEADEPAQDFDEIWHLLRWGDSPSWAIAGIQQQQ